MSGFVDVVSLLSHGLVNLTGFRVRGRKGGSDQSGTGTGSHISLRGKRGCGEGSGGGGRKWQGPLQFLPASIFVPEALSGTPVLLCRVQRVKDSLP